MPLLGLQPLPKSGFAVADAAATDLSFVPGVLTVFDAAIPGVSVAKLTMIGVYSITNFKLTPGNPAVISYV